MLLNYSVKGYKVFYDEVSFSMVADNYIKKNQENLIKNVKDKKDVLKSALIYGANNTGKSCFLESFKYFIGLLKTKNIFYYGDYTIDKNIFTSVLDPMAFKVEFFENNHIYHYEIAYTNCKIFSEILYKDNICIFDRNDEKNEVTKQIVSFLGEIGNELFLSYLPKQYFEVKNAFDSFTNSFLFFDGEYDPRVINKILDENFLNEVNGVMTSLDMHINGLIDNRGIFYTKEEEIFKNALAEDSFFGKQKLLSEYKFKDIVQQMPFGLIDSLGTKKALQLVFYIIIAIKNNKIILIDELGSSLHSVITKTLVAYFNEKSDGNAQLIATTHDLLLLDNNYLLRKDQVWFIHKDENNNYLYSLRDFKDNKENDSRGNVMIKYLKGVFGALPDPNNLF